MTYDPDSGYETISRRLSSAPSPWLLPFLTVLTTCVAGAICLRGHVEGGAITSPWGWVGMGLFVQAACIWVATMAAMLINWRGNVDADRIRTGR